MAGTSSTLTWDNFGTTTKTMFQSAVRSTVWGKTALRAKLYADSVKKQFGNRIEIPVEYSNSTAEVQNKTARAVDSINYYNTERLTNIEFTPGRYQATTSISRQDWQDNEKGGDAQLISLIKFKSKRLPTVLNQVIGQDIYTGTGTNGTGPTGNVNIVGLDTILQATAFGSQTGTYGNLNRANYVAYHQNRYATTALTSLSWSNFHNMVNNCNLLVEDSGVDMIVTTQTIFEYMWDFVDARHAYYTAGEGLGPKVNAGSFKAIDFGGIPIVWDPKATANRIYFLNTNYLKLYIHPSVDMAMDDWIDLRPGGKDAKGQACDMCCQIVCDSLNAQGLIVTT